MVKKITLLLPFLLILFSVKLVAQCGSNATIDVQESRCEATGSISASNISGVGPFTFDFVNYPIDYAYTPVLPPESASASASNSSSAP